MSQSGSNKKRQRTSRKSQGIHGSTRVELSEVDKVILGGGLLDTISEIDCKPWRGTGGYGPPYDPIQAAENKRLYPHLFDQEDR